MNAFVRQTSTTAVLSLVFGILGWIAIPFIGSIVAVICGHMARSEIRRAPASTIEGDGMALAGLILGWSMLILSILAIVAMFMFFGGLAFIAALGAH
ncbi:MAG: DUF4190 domain-containing protein [Xanthomonadales bacterium]|nr:DUF4190 domain-containing protein [Xanthomonadales bacterium]